MTTDAQIAANRANAQLSTGPKTLEGKAKSRQNALRHGLTARQLVAMDEKGEDFWAYHTDLSEALAPQDAFEAALVRRLALLSWRLDRLCRIEAVKLDVGYDNNLGRPRRPENVWPAEMPVLARYESSLDRAFRRTMTMLEDRQAARRRQDTADRILLASRGQKLFLRNEPNLPAANSAANGSADGADASEGNPTGPGI